MAYPHLSIIFMLWSGLAVLSSATILTLSNARINECVEVDAAPLCNCVQSDNSFFSIFRADKGNSCLGNMNNNLDVHDGYIFVASGFSSQNTKDIQSWCDYSGKLSFPSDLKEMVFDISTRCLKDKAGTIITMENKQQCLRSKPVLKELNPYYIEPFSSNPYSREESASVPVSNSIAEQNEAPALQPPSTDPNTPAPIIANIGGDGNTRIVSDNTNKLLFPDTNVKPENRDLVEQTPYPSRRQRRNIPKNFQNTRSQT